MPAAKPPFPTLRRGDPLALMAGGWPFHEGGGLTAHDLSGYGADGTLTGGVSWVGGQHGHSLSFNGTNGYVNIPAALKVGSNATFAFWAITSDVSNRRTVWGQEDAAGAIQLEFNDSGGGLTSIGGFIGGVGGTIWTGAGAFSANVWVHVAFTFTAAGVHSVYVNGVLKNAFTGQPTIADGTLRYIGQRNSAQVANWLGQIDGFVIYPRVLSRDSIAALYADSWRMYRRPSWRLKAAAGGGFQPAWALRGSPVLGTGVF